GNPIVFMYMGGFMIALAVEKWNLHKRIALTIISFIGTSGNRIVLGVLIATAFLSMWISNAATALMMLPIALALVSQIEERNVMKGDSLDSFVKGLLLTVAYSASIGGLATIIGSVPDAVLVGIANSTLDANITFTDWFIFGFPITIVLLAFLFFFCKGILLTVAFSVLIGGLVTIIGSVPKAVLVGIANSTLYANITFTDFFIFVFPITIVLLAFLFFYFTRMKFKFEENEEISS